MRVDDWRVCGWEHTLVHKRGGERSGSLGLSDFLYFNDILEMVSAAPAWS